MTYGNVISTNYGTFFLEGDIGYDELICRLWDRCGWSESRIVHIFSILSDEFSDNVINQLEAL
jgi:hypothetical protein